MKSRIVIILAMVYIGVHKIDGKLTVSPRDTVVKVNDSTSLNCSTSLRADNVHWRHDSNYVYTALGFLQPYNEGRFSVDINASTGACNLVILSVQPSDAGHYECLEDEGFGGGGSAQLIVVDDDPVCESSTQFGVIGPNSCGLKPDEVQLSCHIKYHGNIPPILQWTSNGDKQSAPDGVFYVNSNNNEVTYVLTMNSTLDLNNVSFMCQTTNNSQIQYSCSSISIEICYVFSSELTINMTINDEVHCFANTSQSCSYKWKWFSGDDSTTESYNQILKPKKVGSYRCEATCAIGKHSCTVQSMQAEVYSTTTSSEHNLSMLWVLLLIPAAAIAVISSVVLWKRKNKETHASDSSRQEMLEVHERLEDQRQIKDDELSEKYESDPVVVHTIRMEVSEDQHINGLAILDNELFIVFESTSTCMVYELQEFRFSRQLHLTELGLINPLDMASCKENKCLYIFDFKGNDESNHMMMKINPNGTLIKKWSTGSDYGQGLSVTAESNVILAVAIKNKLNEYLPNGLFIREIILSFATYVQLNHSIKLTNGHFLISLGLENGAMQKVCIVDEDGNLKQSFGDKPGRTIGQLHQPEYMTVDKNGFVFVADNNNDRIMLLDSDLRFKREIISADEEFECKYPRRILLDESLGRLIVANNFEGRENQRILILRL